MPRTLALLFVLTLAVGARGDALETIDGEEITGVVEKISSAGEVTGSGLPEGLQLDSLRSIVRDVKSNPAKSKHVIETHGGGKLLIDSVRLANDKFTVSLDGGEVTLPLDAVRCVRLEPELNLAAFNEALARPPTEQDKIFVKVDMQVDAVNGLIVELSDSELTFEFGGETRRLPHDRLHGIVLAQTGQPKAPSAVVSLANGSRIAGAVSSLADGRLELELQGGAKATLPLSSIERIDLRSSRVVSLSDLEPVSVREETLLTIAQPWQRNRSVSGKTLTLGGRTYSRGIGVHSRSELVYEVPEGFDSFVAVVGIDAAAGGRGDCEVQLLGDGRSLWSQRVKGSEEPHNVQVPLGGAKRLTLLVEPGADFDLGDHLNWADARFLKQAK
jgi:hypothetical protein